MLTNRRHWRLCPRQTWARSLGPNGPERGVTWGRMGEESEAINRTARLPPTRRGKKSNLACRTVHTVAGRRRVNRLRESSGLEILSLGSLRTVLLSSQVAARGK